MFLSPSSFRVMASTPRKRRSRYLVQAREIAAKQGIPLDENCWEQIWLLLDQFAETPYVYAIADRSRGLVKFGKSVNPGARMSAIKTGNAADLRLWGFCRETVALCERSVHAELKRHRVAREWFLINDDTVRVVNKIRESAGLAGLNVYCPV